jgi:outer membrane protein assembly factor BamB
VAPSRHCLTAALSVAVLTGSSAHAQTTDPAAWPQFRSPNASGVATGAASPPTEFGPSKNLLWKTALPPGHSSPAIWGNRIFLTSFDVGSKKLEVLGLDRITGQILWRQGIPIEEFEKVHQLSSPATATPARIGAGGPYFASPVAANGRLIIASGDGMVSVLTAGDHLDVLARNDLGEAIRASPALINGVLYIRTPSGLSAFGQK